jgi:hypothetical protein
MELHNFSIVDSRENCYDFMLTASRNKIYQCLIQGKLYEYNDQGQLKMRSSQFPTHSMFQLANLRSHYVLIGKSTIKFVSTQHPEYSTEVEFHEPISQVTEYIEPENIN